MHSKLRLGVGWLLLLQSASAWAFTFETVATQPCHERLTQSAVTLSGWPGDANPPAPDHAFSVLARNVPFTVSPSVDAWTLALLIGVRDNDTHGFSLSDLPELAAVHNGVDDQDAHCLRSPGEDFDDGDVAAIAKCRAFILAEVDAALGDGEMPDLEATEEVWLALRFQRTAVPLSRYAFHMGRALHAIQDSYSHSIRAGETAHILSVLNYVDPVLSSLFDPLRDGAAHMSSMDSCDGTSELEVRRVEQARRASEELLSAAAAPASTRAQRRANIEAALDNSLAYDPGCSTQNAWCGSLQSILALENPSPSPSQGCSSVTGFAPLWLLALAPLLRRSFSRR